MNNKNSILLVVVILIIGAGFYFFNNPSSNSTTSTGSDTNSLPVSADKKATTTTSRETPAPVSVIHNISITGFAFNPASITVKKGETIVWTNKDTAPHTVTMTGGFGDLKSSALSQNQTYSFAFDKTGTFSYHCNFHPSMKGMVTVTD